MTGHHKQAGGFPGVAVAPCGKIAYVSKKHAKEARRQIGDRTLRPYKCDRCWDAWHLGHLPDSIIHGVKPRRL